MLWVVIILGQLLVFVLVAVAMLIRHQHYLAASAMVAYEPEVIEEVEEQHTLVEQMMMACDKDTAVHEVVLGQRSRLVKAGVDGELADQMMFFLYQRLWS